MAPEQDPRDEKALEALGRGDRAALAELYDRHAHALLTVTLRILRDRQDAEDLVHDVFVEVCGKARDYDPSRGSVRRWLIVRARSRSIDRLRSLEVARRHAMAEATRESAPRSSAPPEWDLGDRKRAVDALDELSPEQRVLVELGYYEGLTHAEMATRCAIPVGTVKSRMSAAMAKLRRSLAPAGGAG